MICVIGGCCGRLCGEVGHRNSGRGVDGGRALFGGRAKGVTRNNQVLGRLERRGAGWEEDVCGCADVCSWMDGRAIWVRRVGGEAADRGVVGGGVYVLTPPVMCDEDTAVMILLYVAHPFSSLPSFGI
jgi:hypothetical protein